jgi:hypothetical protein
MQSSRDYHPLSLLENMSAPRNDPIYYGKWINVEAETTRLGFYAEHSSPIYIRLAPHYEHILFLHWTHTALCLCGLAAAREKPGVQLQLQIAPPYSLFSAAVTEPDFELYVARRDSWEMHEPPLTEAGWSRPTLILTYENESYTINHCDTTCPSFLG